VMAARGVAEMMIESVLWLHVELERGQGIGRLMTEWLGHFEVLAPPSVG
jgi:hypothetical protein